MIVALAASVGHFFVYTYKEARPMKELFLVAHPDDAEVMLGNAIAASEDAMVVVASDGETSSIDVIGHGFCPG
jgi:LmbE family N-acetylglucosaminyl deacetylase